MGKGESYGPEKGRGWEERAGEEEGAGGEEWGRFISDLAKT